jgi:hypothetical protein
MYWQTLEPGDLRLSGGDRERLFSPQENARAAVRIMRDRSRPPWRAWPVSPKLKGVRDGC